MIGFDLLELTDTQQMIVESTRAVVPGDGSLDRVRGLRFAAPGFDRAMMAVVAENGWPLLRVAESDGGLGLGVTEWCTLMRVLGAALVPEPVLSTVLAGALLGAALPDTVLAGETVLVTAWQDRDNGLDWTGGACAEGLTGAKRHVPGVAGADLFAVVTGQGLAVVPRDAGAEAVESIEKVDLDPKDLLRTFFRRLHVPRSELRLPRNESDLSREGFPRIAVNGHGKLGSESDVHFVLGEIGPDPKAAEIDHRNHGSIRHHQIPGPKIDRFDGAVCRGSDFKFFQLYVDCGQGAFRAPFREVSFVDFLLPVAVLE